MPYDPVLGIDLGASYSKIAIRKKRPLPNAQVSFTQFLGQVPSLGICDWSRGKDRWFFGDRAAGLTPGPGAKIHENWKAALFSKEAGPHYVQAVIVAHQFFKWLRSWVEENGVDPAAQRVRVCLPELG